MLMLLKRRRASFARILDEVGPLNADQLMRKARTANRLAKTLKGAPRRLAYSVKHSALIALHIKFPDKVAVGDDPRLPNMIVINLTDSQSGLHVPAKYFSDEEERVCAA